MKLIYAVAISWMPLCVSALDAGGAQQMRRSVSATISVDGDVKPNARQPDLNEDDGALLEAKKKLIRRGSESKMGGGDIFVPEITRKMQFPGVLLVTGTGSDDTCESKICKRVDNVVRYVR